MKKKLAALLARGWMLLSLAPHLRPFSFGKTCRRKFFTSIAIRIMDTHKPGHRDKVTSRIQVFLSFFNAGLIKLSTVNDPSTAVF